MLTNSKLYKIGTNYDRSKGMLCLKKVPCWSKFNCNLETYDKFREQSQNKICECIFCKNVIGMNFMFENELSNRLSDNSFENILHFETLLFNTQIGTLKEFITYTNYSIKNKLHAVAYIYKTKSSQTNMQY